MIPTEDDDISQIHVSRIESPKPRAAHVARKPIPRRKARDILFGPKPIEWTLRQRQALQPSMSEPSLMSTVGAVTMLPRIGTPGSPGQRGKKQEDKDSWIGVLGGKFRVGIPFNKLGEEVVRDTFDSEVYVKWYQSVEAEAVHAASQHRLVISKPCFLPWEDERHALLSELQSIDSGSGEALRLQIQADLYGYLDSKTAVRGFEALLTAMIFRLDDTDTACRTLDGNGSGMLSLMDFAGILGLLAIDPQVVCSMDDIQVFSGLDTHEDGLIRISELREALKLRGFKKRSPPEKKVRKTLAATGPLDKAERSDKKRQTTPVRAVPAPFNEYAITVTAFREGAQSLKGQPAHVLDAKIKWATIARWMASASQRSMCLRRERVLRGWRNVSKQAEDASLEAANPLPLERSQSVNVVPQGTPFVTDLMNEAVGDLVRKEQEEASQEASAAGANPRMQRRSTLQRPPRKTRLTCKEGTLESLAVMRFQEYGIKRFFLASASVKLPDGTTMMSRADLHQFFSDLNVADQRRHQYLSQAALDKHYDEALELQCNATRIGNGLAFWSFKVVLDKVIDSLGLNWQRLVDRCLVPETNSTLSMTQSSMTQSTPTLTQTAPAGLQSG